MCFCETNPNYSRVKTADNILRWNWMQNKMVKTTFGFVWRDNDIAALIGTAVHSVRLRAGSDRCYRGGNIDERRGAKPCGPGAPPHSGSNAVFGRCFLVCVSLVYL